MYPIILPKEETRTRDEFKQLKVGDRVTHPAFIGFLMITQIEQSYDYSTMPAAQWTDIIILRLRSGQARGYREPAESLW